MALMRTRALAVAALVGCAHGSFMNDVFKHRPAAAAAAAATPLVHRPPQQPRLPDARMASTRAKKVFVLGGDGFCGWPTALHLSSIGHEVVIIDDLSRRKIDIELGCSSLTPIATMDERVATWNAISGNQARDGVGVGGLGDTRCPVRPGGGGGDGPPRPPAPTPTDHRPPL